jgi:hypothetical protein
MYGANHLYNISSLSCSIQQDAFKAQIQDIMYTHPNTPSRPLKRSSRYMINEATESVTKAYKHMRIDDDSIDQ